MQGNNDKGRREQQDAHQYESHETRVHEHDELRRMIRDLERKNEELEKEARDLRHITVGDGTKKSASESLQNRVTNIETAVKLAYIAITAAIAALFDRVMSHFAGKP